MSTDTPEQSDSRKPVERLTFWPNLGASFKHIRESVKQEGSRMRRTDPLTLWMVPALAVVLAAVSFTQGPLRIAMAVLAYLSVIVYLMARIGIIRALNAHQTNLIWHLLMATFMAGLLFALILFEVIKLIG